MAFEAQRFADGNRDSFSCTDFVNRFGYSAVDGLYNEMILLFFFRAAVVVCSVLSADIIF